LLLLGDNYGTVMRFKAITTNVTRRHWHELGLNGAAYDWWLASGPESYHVTETGWLEAWHGTIVLGYFGSREAAEKIKTQLMAYKYLGLA
jgi:hypothetical protein